MRALQRFLRRAQRRGLPHQPARDRAEDGPQDRPGAEASDRGAAFGHRAGDALLARLAEDAPYEAASAYARMTARMKALQAVESAN